MVNTNTRKIQPTFGRSYDAIILIFNYNKLSLILRAKFHFFMPTYFKDTSMLEKFK